MTSDAVERYYGQSDPASGTPLGTMLRWLVRWIGASGTMLAWTGIVLLFAALWTPGKLSKGLSCDMGLNQLMGGITMVYYLAVLPLFLIPTRDDEQFTWFVVTALGWIGCLLCSVLFLRGAGQLSMDGLPDINRTTMLGMLAGIFAIGVLVSVFGGGEPQRRLWSATALTVIGGLVCTAAVIDKGRYLRQFIEGRLGFEPEPAMEAIVLGAFAAIVVFVAWAFVLSRLENPTQAFGLMLLVLGFGLAGLLAYGLLRGGVRLRPSAGANEFRCLVATAVIAPFFSWLGMPWTRGGRIGWIAGFVLAGVGVAYLTDTAVFAGGRSFIDQLWTQYDGPHLMPYLPGE